MKVQWFPIYSLHQYMHRLPHYQLWRTVHFYQGWICVDAPNHPCPWFTLGVTRWLAFCALGKHTVAYTHYFNNIHSVFTALKILCSSYLLSLSAPSSLLTTDLITVSAIWPFPKCYIVGIIQYVKFFQDDFFHLGVCV